MFAGHFDKRLRFSLSATAHLSSILRLSEMTQDKQTTTQQQKKTTATTVGQELGPSRRV